MTNARAVYDSINGRIISQWEISGDQLTIHVEIPFNTEATIILPTDQLEKIIESPQECTFKKEGNSIGCNVGSGIYRYVIHYDNK